MGGDLSDDFASQRRPGTSLVPVKRARMKSLLFRMNTAACMAIIVSGCAHEAVAPEGQLSLIVATSSQAVQTASPGDIVGAAPAVTVKDPNGAPVPNVYVSFAVTLGGGTVTQTVAKTDSHGMATSGTWTLGNTSGHGSSTSYMRRRPTIDTRRLRRPSGKPITTPTTPE